MPAMKITVDAAMRARDVSRSRAEREALADSTPQGPRQVREPGRGALPEEPARPAAAADGGAARSTPKGRSQRRRRRGR
jgi:hypothetical protein